MSDPLRVLIVEDEVVLAMAMEDGGGNAAVLVSERRSDVDTIDDASSNCRRLD